MFKLTYKNACGARDRSKVLVPTTLKHKGYKARLRFASLSLCCMQALLGVCQAFTY